MHCRRTRTLRTARGERGQALVELALVLPLFLLLLLGIVQMGSIFRDYIALTDATRVGARQGSVSRSIQPASNRVPTIENRIRRAAVNLDPAKVGIVVQLYDVDGTTPLAPSSLDTNWKQSGDVRVSTTYPFKISLFGQVFYTGQLQSRTTERIE